MLAHRDQENLIHSRQSTAAAKHGLTAKTPGNFKAPLPSARHDENRPVNFNGLKSVTREKAGRPDKVAFVTPVAPRNRAPLGAKTANTKAHAFQTPGPGRLATSQGKGKGVDRSLTRPSTRAKIPTAVTEVNETAVPSGKIKDEEEPDYGYAPPTPVDLPDPPLEVEEDPLLTEELCRNYGQLYVDSQQEEEEYLRHQKEQERKSLDTPNDPMFPSTKDLNRRVDTMIAAGPAQKLSGVTTVDTVKAKSAAAALSAPRPPVKALVARPTHASQQKRQDPQNAPNPSTVSTDRPFPRPGLAAVSRNTIGFPKARKAPSIIPREARLATRDARPAKPARAAPAKAPKIDQNSIHPKTFRDLYGSPPEESDMWFRLREYELLESEVLGGNDAHGTGEEIFDTDVSLFDNARSDYDDFQLALPE